jgi:hypothetical protein
MAPEVATTTCTTSGAGGQAAALVVPLLETSSPGQYAESPVRGEAIPPVTLQPEGMRKEVTAMKVKTMLKAGGILLGD